MKKTFFIIILFMIKSLNCTDLGFNLLDENKTQIREFFAKKMGDSYKELVLILRATISSLADKIGQSEEYEFKLSLVSSFDQQNELLYKYLYELGKTINPKNPSKPIFEELITQITSLKYHIQQHKAEKEFLSRYSRL